MNHPPRNQYIKNLFCNYPFSMFCISLFWPGMVLNQGQLSIVVSDWEPYLGSFFPTYVLWVVIFCLVFSAPDRTVSVSCILFVILFQCSVQVMNTYHTALWSDSSSSDDDTHYSNLYRTTVKNVGP